MRGLHPGLKKAPFHRSDILNGERPKVNRGPCFGIVEFPILIAIQPGKFHIEAGLICSISILTMHIAILRAS